MKSKREWSTELGTIREVVGGIEQVNIRVSQDAVKRIQHDALQEAAVIVSQSGLIGEAVKNIYKRIERL